MATWKELESAEPGFAARARALLDAHKHKTIATLRADGSPRISGIEVQFVGDDLTFGSMPDARKGDDLRRDPRFALHSASVDPPEDHASWAGDAKVAGRAVPAGSVEGPGSGDLFRADVREVVITGLNADATLLVVESWTPERGLRRVERE
ncbi:pyridoxamine 5'-phosphate oxidase family protein [Pseudonocardia petroleophila]|uniref:Pyridoxamine 5'-phosphate oxidase family protein n=1 Tax=Pseudonocardia petroleophila TaxID=37331 RepID=A0A7G7MK83_9PSEU|nr:pyridoxamine 5'-phosphate oxidase family protein [Pseudonocardia petroleophila]QNG53194.1 pyridoxamine 5'-phosphate oxidase family protein [Pseudonocardia petroleophila]